MMIAGRPPVNKPAANAMRSLRPERPKRHLRHAQQVHWLQGRLLQPAQRLRQVSGCKMLQPVQQLRQVLQVQWLQGRRTCCGLDSMRLVPPRSGGAYIYII